jgi:hypothetical protein
MVGPFVLLVLAPAAPVPKAPPPPSPPVEVTAKRYAHPPQLVVGAAGRPELFNIDDGHFVDVTVTNTSRDVISVPYTRKLRERVSVRVTNEKGEDVSDPKRHLGFRRTNDVARVHTLEPGASFTVIVHLEDNWPDDAALRTPGKYTARVVFESGTVRVESAATFEAEIIK